MDFFDNIAKELNIDPTIVVGVILGNRVAIQDIYSIHGTDTINYIITKFKAQIKTLNDKLLSEKDREVRLTTEFENLSFKILEQNSKKFKYKSGLKKGQINLKAMSRAFKKTPAGKKRRKK